MSGEKIIVVYFGHTIELDVQTVTQLSSRHKIALAKHLAFDIQVLRQMQEVAPMLVASDGASTPAKVIEVRMKALTQLAPGMEETLLSEALSQLSSWSGDGAAIQALLLSSGMI